MFSAYFVLFFHPKHITVVSSTLCIRADHLKPIYAWRTHLFESKYVLVEIKLNLLVCDVDAQLLKRVLLEVFKSKDVQDSHIQAALYGTSKEKKGDKQTYSSMRWNKQIPSSHINW